MRTFFRAQAASLIATAADFFTTILCVKMVLIPVVAAGAIGNVAGAIVNFIMGRKWVFDPADQASIGIQMLKYGVVWTGYLVLNALGMALLERYSPLHYIVSKIIVGVTLAVTYNYFLQKKFVFN